MKKKNKKQKSSTNVKKQNVKEKSKPSGKIDIISNALPFSFDEESQLFFTNDNEYIKMIRVQGLNLYGMKQDDQELRMLTLKRLFNPTIRVGQIYSYEIPANVDSYIRDYEHFKNELDLRDYHDKIKYEILDDNQKRLTETSITRELVDRCFLIILKDKSLQRLDQRINNALNVMGNYNSVEELNTQQMTEVIYSYYNPRESSYLKPCYDDSDDIMDFIYPDKIGYVDKQLKQYINLNDIYCTTLYVSKYTKLDLGFLSVLACNPDIEFSLHFEQAPKNEVTSVLDKSLKNTINNLDKAKEGSEATTLADEKNKLAELIGQINVDDDLPMYFSASIRVKADTIEELNSLCTDIKNELSDNGFKIRSGIFQSLSLFNLTAPICCNDVPVYMKQTTNDTLGWGYPFVFETLYDSTPKYDIKKNKLCNYPPFYMGNTVTTGGTVFYDNFTKQKDRANYNEFIAGTSGFGKTTLIMALIKYRYSISFKQHVLDIEGKELNKLTRELGGEIIDCSNGENGRINPLQVRIRIPDNLDKGTKKVSLDKIKPLSSHVRFLRTFLKAYKGDSKDIGILHDSEIETAAENVYARKNITYETTADIIVNMQSDEFPIFSDVYDEIISMKSAEEKAEFPNRNRLKILDECLAFLKSLSYGADSEVFNGHTNINLKNKLFCYDLSGLHDNTAGNVLGTQYLNILTYIWSTICSSDGTERTQIYEDEISVISNPNYEDILVLNEDMLRRLRKYLAGLTVATQEMLDLLKKSIVDHTKVLMTQPTYKFLFNLDPDSLDYLKTANQVPSSEIEWLQKVEIGKCFAKFGNQTSMRVSVDLDQKTLEQFEEMKS